MLVMRKQNGGNIKRLLKKIHLGVNEYIAPDFRPRMTFTNGLTQNVENILWSVRLPTLPINELKKQDIKILCIVI